MFDKIRQIRKDAIHTMAETNKVLGELANVKQLKDSQRDKVLGALANLRQVEKDYEAYGTHLLNRLIRFVVCGSTMKKVKNVYQSTFVPLTRHLNEKWKAVHSVYKNAPKDIKNRPAVEKWYADAKGILQLHERYIVRVAEETELSYKMKQLDSMQVFEKRQGIVNWYSGEIGKLQYCIPDVISTKQNCSNIYARSLMY